MAEIVGLVVKKQGERAQIKVDRTESERKSLPKYLDCWNPIGANPGDTVGAEYRDLDKHKAQWIMYGLPVAGLLAGVAFGNSLATFFHMDKLPFIAGGVVLWEIVTIAYARMFKRDAVREGLQAVIYEVHVEEMVIDTGK